MAVILAETQFVGKAMEKAALSYIAGRDAELFWCMWSVCLPLAQQSHLHKYEISLIGD